jgi:glycosyltransferase involved in cell wall biosynthesis
MKNAVNSVRLFAFVSARDSDLLRPFIRHYRAIGVDRFTFVLHGHWEDQDLTPLREDGVEICDRDLEPFSGQRKQAILQRHALAAQGEWIVIADADEFLEVPFADIPETIRYLDFLGAEDLPSVLLQRVAAGGELAAIGDANDLHAVFPYFDYCLSERMEVPGSVWKGKYPLVRVGENFRTTRGNHLPHLGRAAALTPVRAVMHHFKWRDRLRGALGKTGGANSHSTVAQSHGAFLEKNDWRLPVEGLERYSRAALFQRGYLVRPDRGSLKRLSILRQARDVRLGKNEPSRYLLKQLGAIPTCRPAANTDSGTGPWLDRSNLALRPGRVALVTTEINGPDQSGGIGTAMAALAERLADHGHDVHVFLCPWKGSPELRPAVPDYWKSRGVALHYHPRWGGGQWTSHDAFSVKLSETLSAGTWDIIHFQEAAGYAAVPLLLRAAGLAFQGSKIVLTAHGPSQWHKRGNYLPWHPEEAWHTLFEEIALHLADAVICPTAYIRDWCRAHYSADITAVVVPNSLTAETRRFALPSKTRRAVKTFVFFGRIELRKGIDRFLDAVSILIRQGLTGFDVVFLGGFGVEGTFAEETFRQRVKDWPVRIRVINNYDNNEAVNFLRNSECLAVVPSRLDNLPYTVFECLENGVPIVSSDIGGIPELVTPEERHRVLAAGDVNSLAIQLREALEQGVSPATLAFDPNLADVDLMALHAGLVDEARHAQRAAAKAAAPSPVAVALYGSPTPEVCAAMLAVLDRWVAEGRVTQVLFTDAFQRSAPGLTQRVGSVFQVVPVASLGIAYACNRLAEQATAPIVLFWGGLVAPESGSLDAMMNLMVRGDADAVVCGYSVSGGSTVASRNVNVFGGPVEIGIRQNVFGPRFFLIRKQALLRSGGFSADSDVEPIADWELLNRVKASGERVLGVPTPLATIRESSLPAYRASGDSLIERLAAPWTDQAAPYLQPLLRMGLRPRPVRLDEPRSMMTRLWGLFSRMTAPAGSSRKVG